MGIIQDWTEKLNRPETAEHLAMLYGGGEETVRRQLERYAALIRRHTEVFPENGPVFLFSAPGRTEIGGNHTDHNRGRVLAASVSLDTLCAVSSRKDSLVHFYSEGYAPITVDLSTTEPVPEEEGTTAALIRGVADGMKLAGYRIGGFDAVATSQVASGSGLSSSAALEVMLTGVLDGLYNDFAMPFQERAQISRRAENLHFGKPSGLLDQMASAAGGLVTVDFQDDRNPKVEALGYDFARKGFALVVVGTGGSHANLTEHYAAIPREMKMTAACFGQETLRGITREDLLGRMGELRKSVSDRALLRAMHFVEEDARVPEQVSALKEDRIEDFLRLINESGRSSCMYLQNIYATAEDESLCLALCVADALLKGKGAWRIHGGGFAGTTLNFVPFSVLEDFVRVMNGTFGENACHVLNIRPVGADRMAASDV